MQELRGGEFHVNVVTEHIHGVGPVAKVTFYSLSIYGKFIEHNA
jgi:hypothetical protein